ncbi:MAG: prenyltransferase [Bacteroidota bacterium]
MPLTEEEVGLSEKDIWKRWLQAVKLNSWPKILVPFFLGHALGVYQQGTINWGVFLFSFIAVVAGVIFIVLINDWGDQRVDKIKRNMFPESCSPKTIPDAILPAKQVFIVGFIACIVGFLGIISASFFINHPVAALQYALLSCFTFVAYTLPPIKLNYRGGGELLEMLGVGFFLPLFMFFLQSGSHIPVGFFQIILPFATLSLSSAIASGLSDENSDREGGKRTFVTLFGNKKARIFIEILLPVSVIFSLIISRWGENVIPLWLMGFIQLIVVYNYLKMRKISHLVVSNAFSQQKQYKFYLHNAIWWSATFTGVILFATTF